MNTKLPQFLSLLANIKLAHWQANSKTNEHESLGDLYDALEPLVDKYAELTLGKRGNRDIETVEGLNLTVNADYLDIVNSGLALIGECRSHWMTGIDDDMLNTLADMSTAFNHAKFFLIL